MSRRIIDLSLSSRAHVNLILGPIFGTIQRQQNNVPLLIGKEMGLAKNKQLRVGIGVRERTYLEVRIDEVEVRILLGA